MAGPKRCFISYAHHDHPGFQRLLVYLTALSNNYDFAIWHDERLNAGYRWHATILDELSKSDLIVPLVSADFLASPYIREHELPAIADLWTRNAALVAPIIYTACPWKSVFGKYIQCAPKKNGKLGVVPVCEWPNRETAFGGAAEEIGKAIESWFGCKPVSPFAPRVPGGAP
jgi:hypothetical protein